MSFATALLPGRLRGPRSAPPPPPVPLPRPDRGRPRIAARVRLRLLRYRLAAGAVARLPLVGVLAVQAVMTLRLSNSAFQDEALYLYAGHREIAQYLHGTPTFDNYTSYFSGAPWLYPVLGAVADGLGGLQAARAVSLVFMLAATVLVGAVAGRLLDPDAAMPARVIFAVAGPVLFMGRLATYDALAVFLLALSSWIVVAAARRHPLAVCAAAPVLVLAVLTKYASLIFVPTILVTAVLARLAIPARRRWRWISALSRPLLLGAACAALAVGVLRAAGSAFLRGVTQTTTSRAPGTDSVAGVLHQSAEYLVAPLILALVGVALYAREQRTTDGPPRWLRLSLGIVLTGSALLAPVYQAHLHTVTSLQKHAGYGLIFAAPMAGLALARLLKHGSLDPRRLGLVLGVCLLLAALGLNQSQERFHDWPASGPLVQVLRSQVRPVTGRYLVEESEVPRYYLRDLTEPYQWTGTYVFDYTDHAGQHLSGVAAYKAAIAERYFDLVALRYGPTAALDVQIDGLLRASQGYQQIAAVPADSSYGSGTFTVWRAVR